MNDLITSTKDSIQIKSSSNCIVNSLTSFHVSSLVDEESRINSKGKAKYVRFVFDISRTNPDG